jgi:hypothetical protein
MIILMILQDNRSTKPWDRGKNRPIVRIQLLGIRIPEFEGWSCGAIGQRKTGRASLHSMTIRPFGQSIWAIQRAGLRPLGSCVTGLARSRHVGIHLNESHLDPSRVLTRYSNRPICLCHPFNVLLSRSPPRRWTKHRLESGPLSHWIFTLLGPVCGILGFSQS